MINFKLYGIKISFSYWFFLVIIILTVIDKTKLFLISYICLILHEAGHLLGAKLTKTKIESVTFSLGTVKILREETISIHSCLLIAVSGPLINLILSTLLLIKFTNFGLFNLVIGIYNLLPVIGLDGGDIVEYALIKSKHKTVICNIISYITLLIVFLAGVYVLLQTGYNATLVITAIYLLFLPFFKTKG